MSSGYNAGIVSSINNSYHYLVLSISGTTHTLYLDASAIATNTNAGNVFASYSSISNIMLGCGGDLTNAFTGFIDDFRVFNRTLLQSDVSSLYNLNPPPTNVVLNAIGSTMTVSFTAPSSGLATSYTVTATPISGSVITKTGTSSPITVTGLVAGQTYTVGLSATSQDGNSRPVYSLINILDIIPVDSSMAFYYTFDNSGSTGNLYTPNYSTGKAVYDASFIGGATTSAASGNFVQGANSLALTNTYGSTATQYLSSSAAFTPNVNNGFTLSVWFDISAVPNTIASLFDVTYYNGKGLSIDISGTSSIYSSYSLLSTFALNTDSSLLIYYTFDVGSISGTTLYNYATGSPVANATIYNSPTISNSDYKVGNGSMSFTSGSSQYAQITASSFSYGTNGVTVAFWIKPVSCGTWARVFDFGSGSGNNNYDCTVSSGFGGYGAGNLEFQVFYGSVYIAAVCGLNVNNNTWTHIAITMTYAAVGSATSTWQLYANGVVQNIALINNGGGAGTPAASIQGYYPQNVSNYYIGKSNWADPYFNGYMDDFRIYGRVLTSTEITSLYNYTGP